MTTFFVRWMLVVAMLGACLGVARAEPTVDDIYATARAGKISDAQVMVQQVLVAHPNSAKAHFVQSELYARQGNLGRARDALATAEQLAPGLPFAKPEAVTALRNQINPVNGAPVARMASPVADRTAPSNNWLLPVLLAGGVIIIAYFMFRPRRPVDFDGNGGALNGPQSFGPNGGGALQPTYGPSPYGPNQYAGAYGQQPVYGQAPGSGLGGRIMGGVATGLAVGAGVVAAEAIGRNLMEGHDRSRYDGNFNDGNVGNNYEPVNPNPNMGGQDFGINDTASWDDAGSGGGGGGGGDWDN